VAKQAFTRFGADSSLDDIAKQAGVEPEHSIVTFPPGAVGALRILTKKYHKGFEPAIADLNVERTLAHLAEWKQPETSRPVLLPGEDE
jgi:hypothetical protein